MKQIQPAQNKPVSNSTPFVLTGRHPEDRGDDPADSSPGLGAARQAAHDARAETHGPQAPPQAEAAGGQREDPAPLGSVPEAAAAAAEGARRSGGGLQGDSMVAVVLVLGDVREGRDDAVPHGAAARVQRGPSVSAPPHEDEEVSHGRQVS